MGPEEARRQSVLTPPRLYPILDASFPAAWPAGAAVTALGRAGCTWVQLRSKSLSTRAFYAWAEEAVAAGEAAGVRVLVNDRIDVALASGAAGAHMGQEDLAPDDARRLLGRSGILGLSTHTLAEFEAAQEAPVDYVAVGPVFKTRTKPTDRDALGLSGVSARRARARKPLVAIGGITSENARTVLEAGADGVAVISALLESKDLESAARDFLRSLAA